MAANTAALRSPLWPASWSLDSFSIVSEMDEYYPPDKVTKYPLRYLRYWFLRHLLEAHAQKLGRPIEVLEVGVDRGQMRAFMGAAREATLPDGIARWDAVDIAADREHLLQKGYTDYLVFNVEGETRFPSDKRYDAIIFLHLLEHLHDPEACLKSFLPVLKPEGIIAGGSPTMPKFVADMGYAKRLSRKARPFGHVSVLSPERIERFASSQNLVVQFLSGSFFARSSGSWIENYSAWIRVNVAFGSLFPSLGGELYFSLSR